MKKQSQLPLNAAIVRPNFARALVVETNASLLDDKELLASPARLHAAEYIGRLMECIDLEELEGDVLRDGPDSDYIHLFSMGAMLSEAKQSMLEEHRISILDGNDPEFDPTVLDDDKDNPLVVAAVAAVQDHMATVYNQAMSID